MGKQADERNKNFVLLCILLAQWRVKKGLVLGQQATVEKSNEKTAISELLERLMLKGCVVTIDAMGTQANIAKKITGKEGDYILSVKDNQKNLAGSIRDYYAKVGLKNIRYKAFRRRQYNEYGKTV